MVERGHHDKLVTTNGLYSELYRTQFERQAHGDDAEAFPTALPRTRTQQRAGHRDRLPVTVFHNPLPDALLGWYVRHWLSPSRWSIIVGQCAPSSAMTT